QKEMRWRRPGCDGYGLRGLPVSELPLYGSELLPALASGSTVVVAEGEAAAGAGSRLGGSVLGAGTGGSTAPADDVRKGLIGYDVVLWPDKAPPGRRHMATIGKRLVSIGVTPRLLEWPEAPDKGDAADFVAAGGNREALAALVAAAPSVTKGLSSHSSFVRKE